MYAIMINLAIAEHIYIYSINAKCSKCYLWASDGTFIDETSILTIGPYTIREILPPLFNGLPAPTLIFSIHIPIDSIGTWSAQNGAGGANPLRAQGLEIGK